MSNNMSIKLNTVIIDEISKRGWSIRELAKRADLAHGTVNSVLAQKSKPGITFCNGIARALKEPPERIFRLAGILPPVIIGQEREKELLDLFRHLDISDQNRIIRIARDFYQERFTNDTEPMPK